MPAKRTDLKRWASPASIRWLRNIDRPPRLRRLRRLRRIYLMAQPPLLIQEGNSESRFVCMTTRTTKCKNWRRQCGHHCSQPPKKWPISSPLLFQEGNTLHKEKEPVPKWRRRGGRSHETFRRTDHPGRAINGGFAAFY